MAEAGKGPLFMPSAVEQRSSLATLVYQLAAARRHITALSFDAAEFQPEDCVAYARSKWLIPDESEHSVVEDAQGNLILMLDPDAPGLDRAQVDVFEVVEDGEPVVSALVVSQAEDAPTQRSILYRAPAAIVGVRSGTGSGNDDLMGLLRSRVPDPDALADNHPFFFRVQASNGLVDSYGTRMMDDTLQNFATDATTGISVQDSHQYTWLPLGGSLRGEFKKGGRANPSRMFADLFMWPGLHNGKLSTDDVIRGVRLGQYRDVSVGFYDGEIRCNICGIDMFDMSWLWDDDAPYCPHMPGAMYDVDGEKRMAEGQIFGSHLAEISLVYDGATPDAMVEKVYRMVESGRMPRDMAQRFEQRYRMRVPDVARRFAGFDFEPALTERERPVPTDRKPTTPPAAPTAERVTELEARIAELEEAERTLRSEVSASQTFSTRILALMNAPAESGTDWAAGNITVLMARAKIGDAYRKDLIDTAIRTGIAAYGNEWDAERYRAVLDRTDDLETIKMMTADWERVAGTTVPRGRGTSDAADEVRSPTPIGAPSRRRVGALFG